MPRLTAEIAVIGGSGFYELFSGGDETALETPYGPPSGPVTVADIGGRPVAFLPRHGPGHRLPPHRVPFRANVWALKQMGVARILAPCAVGSLRPDVHPGDFVLCDQFVDRTWGRPDTFFEGPTVHHVALADPYCPELRMAAGAGLAAQAARVHDEGTVVVVQGPRFSTRAESAFYRSAGWDVINMTQHPEAALAREAGICYAAVALVTDYDTGVDDAGSSDAVTMDAVFAVLGEMVDTFRAALDSAIPEIPIERNCGCAAGAGPALPALSTS